MEKAPIPINRKHLAFVLLVWATLSQRGKHWQKEKTAPKTDRNENAPVLPATRKVLRAKTGGRKQVNQTRLKLDLVLLVHHAVIVKLDTAH